MQTFRDWAAVWGNASSVVGLAVSILGFGVTIAAVLRSKSAAVQAAAAAQQTKELLVHSSTIADFSAAVVSMQEIKRLHRAKAWALLPDRYAALRERLIAIRSSNQHLDIKYVTAIRSAEDHFAELERRVDRALAAGVDPPNTGKFNDIVSTELDKLHEALTALKQQTGD